MTPSRPDDGSARRDAAWVVAATLATFALASIFELHEKVAAIALRWEAWQADEFPLTVTSLAIGLAWYAWRRRHEAARLLQHNRELARQLIDLQESERRALARELHDEIAQHCTVIRIEAAYAHRSTDVAEMAASASRAAEAASLLHEGVRRLLRRLRPAELDELGLVDALQSLCAAWSVASGVGCRFEPVGALAALGTEVDMAIYRVAQEALANVMQHAQATRVDVRLEAGEDGVVLQVDDDGCGIQRTAQRGQRRGLGLLGAGERAAALHGELQVTGASGRGTRLRLWIPRDSGSIPGATGSFSLSHGESVS